MRLGILLITLSVLLGCKQEPPNAYICSFVLKEPVGESYSFCVNMSTKEEAYIHISRMAKYITMSPDDYLVVRDWYKKECKASVSGTPNN